MASGVAKTQEAKGYIYKYMPSNSLVILYEYQVSNMQSTQVRQHVDICVKYGKF